MGQVANNPGEFTLSSNGDSTGWFPIDETVDDIGFNITGTWVGTIALQVSNQSDYTKTRVSTVASYASNQSPLNIPREIGRYFRFAFTAYTSGTAYIGLSKAVSSSDRLTNLAPQTNTNDPVGTF